MACIVQSDYVVATAFFIAGAALKLKTFLAAMTISLPVLGLRPLREFFLRRTKTPKFFIFTFSPRSKEALIISNVASTILMPSLCESLFLSHIRSTISALVIVIFPWQWRGRRLRLLKIGWSDATYLAVWTNELPESRMTVSTTKWSYQ